LMVPELVRVTPELKLRMVPGPMVNVTPGLILVDAAIVKVPTLFIVRELLIIVGIVKMPLFVNVP